MKKLECAQPNGLRHEPRTNLSTHGVEAPKKSMDIRSGQSPGLPRSSFSARSGNDATSVIGTAFRVGGFARRDQFHNISSPLSWFSPDLNTCISARRGRGTGFRTSGTSRCCVDTLC